MALLAAPSLAMRPRSARGRWRQRRGEGRRGTRGEGCLN